MEDSPAPAVPTRLAIHAMPQTFDVERICTSENVRQPVPSLGRARGLENSLADIGLAANLSNTSKPGVGVDSDYEDMLGTIGNLLHVWKSKLDSFHIGNDQRSI